MAYGVARTKQQKDEMIETLRPYLQLGMTVRGACKSAGLPISTITDYIRQDEASGGVVRLKINAWRNVVSTQARYNIVQKIMEGDIKCSRWWLDKTKSLERSEKEIEEERQQFEEPGLSKDTEEAIALLMEMD